MEKKIAVCMVTVAMFLSENALAQTFSSTTSGYPSKISQSRENRQNVKKESPEKRDEAIERISKSFSQKTEDKKLEYSDSFSKKQKNTLAEGSQNKKEFFDEYDVAQEENEDIFIPEGELYRLDTPTTDGSPRGGQAFVEVDDKGRMKKTSKIFLFYDQFKMINISAKIPTCNVRFNILSTLDKKINQLDIKLVWPELTTTLSFSDIIPNTQTYYNYALLSRGCYNMNKAPNIIVNRCRIKGMTAAECANKLQWLSK